MNYANWINATYRGYNDPRENTTEQECCKECGEELEMYEGDMLCYSCEVCDDCKDYKECCDCSTKDITIVFNTTELKEWLDKK
tara:strand:+ start:512 stop:760 length:249 start_codon:yes stop_codon:yes gene_type:complete